jgi:hypothetical protein
MQNREYKFNYWWKIINLSFSRSVEQRDIFDHFYNRHFTIHFVVFSAIIKIMLIPRLIHLVMTSFHPLTHLHTPLCLCCISLIVNSGKLLAHGAFAEYHIIFIYWLPTSADIPGMMAHGWLRLFVLEAAGSGLRTAEGSSDIPQPRWLWFSPNVAGDRRANSSPLVNREYLISALRIAYIELTMMRQRTRAIRKPRRWNDYRLVVFVSDVGTWKEPIADDVQGIECQTLALINI